MRFSIKALKAEYRGTKKERSYVGDFNQNGTKLNLSFAPIESRPEIKRPQDPKKPYPYLEEEVFIPNNKEAKPRRSAGTLTLPKEGAPHPAAVLITGSGAQNRNEELFHHRPFLVIADHLTRRGVAVLRVDDRGVGKSDQGGPNDTSETYAGDVASAVEYLASRKDIDPKRIGLIGHSEGGTIAPMVAASRPDSVAFIVMLAGTAVTGEEILKAQTEKLMTVGGASKNMVDANRRIQEAMFEISRNERDPAARSKALRAKIDQIIDGPDFPEEFRKSFETPESRDLPVKQIDNAWMRFFLTYDPRPTLAKVKCPTLALNGELDLQVLPDQNLAEIEKAIKSGGNKNVTTHRLPKLNHLFQSARSGAVSEYGAIQETFSPKALELMSDWIVELMKPARR
jgi:hypothetical protein